VFIRKDAGALEAFTVRINVAREFIEAGAPEPRREVEARPLKKLYIAVSNI
jgi:hypothetical protein